MPATARSNGGEARHAEKTKAERRAAVRVGGARADAREARRDQRRRRRGVVRAGAGRNAPESQPGRRADVRDVGMTPPDPTSHDAKIAACRRKDASGSARRRRSRLSPWSRSRSGRSISRIPPARRSARRRLPRRRRRCARRAGGAPAAAMAAPSVDPEREPGSGRRGTFRRRRYRRARVFGVADVASVLATPDLVGLGSRKDGDARNRDAPATDGALAFVDALGAFAERHSRGDDDDGQRKREPAGRRRATTLRDRAATLCARSPPLRPPSSTMMTRASTDRVTGIGHPIREKRRPIRTFDLPSATHALLTRSPRVGARGGDELLLVRGARSYEGAGADAAHTTPRSRRSARGTRDDAAWAAVRATRGERRGVRIRRGAGCTPRRRRARAAERRDGRLRASARGDGGARACGRAGGARRATARKLESDAAKPSRDRKTVASARADD